jgi:hypothetical protein
VLLFFLHLSSNPSILAVWLLFVVAVFGKSAAAAAAFRPFYVSGILLSRNLAVLL